MAYNVTLRQFEGPLDLLLHLIEKAEVDIRDVFVSEITSQYLEYVSAADDLDMELSSEFITMAATLLYIKSRSLLPKPPREPNEFEIEEDPEVTLMRQLREYKAYKEATAKLSELQDAAQLSYTKLPEEFILPEQTVELIGGVVDDLHAAFMELLNRTDGIPPEQRRLHEVEADHYTVDNCMQEIRGKLRENAQNGEMDFYSLFEGANSKLRIIVMFMALLELIMRAEVAVHQSQCFGSITVSALDLNPDDDDFEDTYI